MPNSCPVSDLVNTQSYAAWHAFNDFHYVIENVDENNLVAYPSGRNCRVEFQYDGNEYSFVPFQVNTDEYDQNSWETGNIRCAGFGAHGTPYKVNGKFPWSLGQKIADTTFTEDYENSPPIIQYKLFDTNGDYYPKTCSSTPDDDSWQSMTVGAPIPEMTNVDSSGCFGNQYNGNCKIDLEGQNFNYHFEVRGRLIDANGVVPGYDFSDGNNGILEAINTNGGACTEEDGDACDYCNDCLPNTDQLSVTLNADAYQIVKDRCDDVSIEILMVNHNGEGYAGPFLDVYAAYPTPQPEIYAGRVARVVLPSIAEGCPGSQ
eukprot:Pgem_evm1s18946